LLNSCIHPPVITTKYTVSDAYFSIAFSPTEGQCERLAQPEHPAQPAHSELPEPPQQEPPFRDLRTVAAIAKDTAAKSEIATIIVAMEPPDEALC
jgi:hypothetical protein